MLGLYGDGAVIDVSDVVHKSEVDNENGLIPDSSADQVNFTGLVSGTAYYFYFVDYSPGSGLYAAFTAGPYTPELNAVAITRYSVLCHDETITLRPILGTNKRRIKTSFVVSL